MGRLRTALTGMAISVAIFVGLGSAIVAYDLRLHHRFDAVSTLNHRGYRGAILGDKQPNEIRIGLFGGSVAMGYGVASDRSIAAVVQETLNHRGSQRRYTVVNLASNGEAALSYFKPNYELFRYLDLDVVLFYACEDLSRLRTDVDVPEFADSARSSNPGMRLLGYYFVFPTIVREKYYLLRYRNIEEGYRTDKLLRWVDVLSDRSESQSMVTESLYAFVDQLVRDKKTVILTLCPSEPRARQAFMQRVVTPLAGKPRVIVADLNGAFAGVESRAYSDGMHYTETGNRVIGELLATRYLAPVLAH